MSSITPKSDSSRVTLTDVTCDDKCDVFRDGAVYDGVARFLTV